MKYAFVDYRIEQEEKENLTLAGCAVIPCPPSEALYEAVKGHPDMLINIFKNKNIVVHAGMSDKFIKTLSDSGMNVIKSKNYLQSSYPYDVILNGFYLESLFVHNIKYTDEVLLELNSEKKLVNIKQGYSKCSTAIVSCKAVITSDTGIAKALHSENIDVLLLPPGDILLPGLDYGFIGGCCGLIDERLLAFYGHLDNYAFKSEVVTFLRKHKVEPLFLSKGKLIDRGSILVT